MGAMPPTWRTARTCPGVASPSRSPQPADLMRPRGWGRSQGSRFRSAAALSAEGGQSDKSPRRCPSNPDASPWIPSTFPSGPLTQKVGRSVQFGHRPRIHSEARYCLESHHDCPRSKMFSCTNANAFRKLPSVAFHLPTIVIHPRIHTPAWPGDRPSPGPSREHLPCRRCLGPRARRSSCWQRAATGHGGPEWTGRHAYRR